jgi:hypothetical protein
MAIAMTSLDQVSFNGAIFPNCVPDVAGMLIIK